MRQGLKDRAYNKTQVVKFYAKATVRNAVRLTVTLCIALMCVWLVVYPYLVRRLIPTDYIGGTGNLKVLKEALEKTERLNLAAEAVKIVLLVIPVGVILSDLAKKILHKDKNTTERIYSIVLKIFLGLGTAFAVFSGGTNNRAILSTCEEDFSRKAKTELIRNIEKDIRSGQTQTLTFDNKTTFVEDAPKGKVSIHITKKYLYVTQASENSIRFPVTENDRSKISAALDSAHPEGTGWYNFRTYLSVTYFKNSKIIKSFEIKTQDLRSLAERSTVHEEDLYKDYSREYKLIKENGEIRPDKLPNDDELEGTWIIKRDGEYLTSLGSLCEPFPRYKSLSLDDERFEEPGEYEVYLAKFLRISEEYSNTGFVYRARPCSDTISFTVGEKKKTDEPKFPKEFEQTSKELFKALQNRDADAIKRRMNEKVSDCCYDIDEQAEYFFDNAFEFDDFEFEIERINYHADTDSFCVIVPLKGRYDRFLEFTFVSGDKRPQNKGLWSVSLYDGGMSLWIGSDYYELSDEALEEIEEQERKEALPKLSQPNELPENGKDDVELFLYGLKTNDPEISANTFCEKARNDSFNEDLKALFDEFSDGTFDEPTVEVSNWYERKDTFQIYITGKKTLDTETGIYHDNRIKLEYVVGQRDEKNEGLWRGQVSSSKSNRSFSFGEAPPDAE